MGIPKRIRDDSADADNALQQIASNRTAAENEPAAPDVVVAAAPDLTPEPRIPQAPVVVASPVTPESHEALNQQYRTLQGMFNRQNAVIADMEARLSELATAAAKPAPKAAPAPAAPVSLLTAVEREEYGEEFVGVVQKAAREVIEPLLARIMGRVDRLEASLRDAGPKIEAAHQVAAMTQEDRFFNALAAALPAWEEVNLEPELLDWLQKSDKLSGNTYRAMLDKAYAELNAERVAEVFKTYLTEQGRSPARQPAQPSNRPAVDPTTLVSPSASAARAPNANPQAGTMYTMADIDTMYRDKRKGRFTPQEWADTEAKINRAMTEGRIR